MKFFAAVSIARRGVRLAGISFFVIAGVITPTSATGAESDAESARKDRFTLSDLLPTAWQKRPKVRFNVFTEVSAEGRKRGTPTAEKPLTYFAPPGAFEQPGWQPAAGEKPPPWPSLQEAMQKALSANGYVTVADGQRPDILVVFTYGSHGTDLESLAADAETPPITAEELVNWALQDSAAVQDVVRRARFIGGDRVAIELLGALKNEVENARFNTSVTRVGGNAMMPVNPEPGSPFQLLLHASESDAVRNVVELAFHTCYFVTATAYDFNGVEKKQKIPLWQTRMTIEAQGVAMEEVLKPLIVNTGAYLGRETPEAITVGKRIDREGHVEVSAPTVVEELKPGAAAEKSGRR